MCPGTNDEDLVVLVLDSPDACLPTCVLARYYLSSKDRNCKPTCLSARWMRCAFACTSKQAELDEERGRNREVMEKEGEHLTLDCRLRPSEKACIWC
jgi:hypothetical protein